jgi:type VI secretion system VgrG family protein
MTLPVTFDFTCVPMGSVKVSAFSGTEAISSLWRFEIELISTDPRIALDRVIGQAGELTLTQGSLTPRRIRGLVAEAEQRDELPYGQYRYRVVLVPRFWLMTLSLQSQIFGTEGDMTVPDIVKAELTGDKLKGPATDASPKLDADAFAFRLSEEYPTRDYVVQYQETDFDFVSRLLEREGIYYFFAPQETREQIIFCDDKVHHPDLPGRSELSLRHSDTTLADLPQIDSFTAAARLHTNRMQLDEYNYRTPRVRLHTSQKVGEGGHGLVALYGEHFKTTAEGRRLAQVRAQGIASRAAICLGESDVAQLIPGYRFALSGHFRTDMNGRYLLTRVTHSGRQPLPGIAGLGDDGSGHAYRNSFECLSVAHQFRPELVTPRPKLHGLMTGFVDGTSSGERAEIDEQGRYKVIVPFDLSGRGGGKASRFIRMAQPYGGAGNGMHFPLTKGTEVVWGCIGGDPDRPIIVGAVPNPANPSVVTQRNQTCNIIRTMSGAVIEFQDGVPPAGGTA